MAHQSPESHSTHPAHPSHPDVDRRLARVSGHLDGVRRMIAEGKPCCDILQQMKAVMAALEKARRILALDHARHCLGESIRKGRSRAALEELELMLTHIWT